MAGVLYIFTVKYYFWRVAVHILCSTAQ